MTQPDTQIADAAPPAGATPASIETAATPTLQAVDRPGTPAPAGTRSQPADDLVLDDLLVEDVSIDGMCGVY
jgi:mycofactocin precursor